MFRDEGVENNTDDEDDDDETGAAAWMETSHFGGVVWSERLFDFVIPDRFVFGAVVFEDAAEAWEKRKDVNISEEDGHF